MIRFLPALVVLAAVAGCASAGDDFDDEAIARLQVGVSTWDEAPELLGARPQSAAYSPAYGMDCQSYGYVSYNAVLATRSQLKSATLCFDAEGRLAAVPAVVNFRLSADDRFRLKVQQYVVY